MIKGQSAWLQILLRKSLVPKVIFYLLLGKLINQQHRDLLTMGRSRAKKWKCRTKKQRFGQQAIIPNEEMEFHPDLVHDQSCELVLELLERIFMLLVVLNDAFHGVYPPEHFCCSPALQHQDYHKRLTVAGQGEQMSFVGMLLRTADRIRWLFIESLIDGKPFKRKLKKVNRGHAHGLAVLHFLIAGMYQPWIDHDSLILLYFLHLVHELKEAGKICKGHHPPIKLYEFYTEKGRNCTMNLITHLLNRCQGCATTEGVKVYKEKLRVHLDPSSWHGCSDCESMLVDTLVYTTMLSHTNFRMMASLRLSLDYDMKVMDRFDLKDQTPEVIVSRSLFKLGYTEVSIRETICEGENIYDSLHKVSMDFDILFISGWKVDKNDLNCLVMEGFLKRKEKRPFFIQCDHQLQRYDRKRRCCEPQIKKHVKKLMRKLTDADRPSGVRTATVTLILEQDPCKDCEDEEHIPAIKRRLARVPLQHVTMLPYIPRSVYLQRLTQHGGPVQLLGHLCPIEEGHVDGVRKCEHSRCGRKRCHYSNPGKVLAVDEKELRRY